MTTWRSYVFDLRLLSNGVFMYPIYYGMGFLAYFSQLGETQDSKILFAIPLLALSLCVLTHIGPERSDLQRLFHQHLILDYQPLQKLVNRRTEFLVSLCHCHHFRVFDSWCNSFWRDSAPNSGGRDHDGDLVCWWPCANRCVSGL